MKINFYYHIDKATGEKHTQKIVPQTGNHVSYFLAKLHPLHVLRFLFFSKTPSTVLCFINGALVFIPILLKRTLLTSEQRK
jgi:hypothetical protein